MSILKKPYEISIWDERLLENGQKEETKKAIIGAQDMDYLGRAINIKFQTKINGTHVLTFDLIDRFYDCEINDYVRNEFVDMIFNEKKIKLFYKNEWFEFYVKSVSENKDFKSYRITYTCTDSFIEELSRNGYGITFDTELYNNVEEIGIFTEEILDDSLWSYKPEYNWGDFTEYNEEKLFKIPVENFSQLVGYKLEYKCPNKEIKNIYNNKKRPMEIGDDLARQEQYFWDNGSFDKGFELINNAQIDIPNDGYIYVPYSQLNFCYVDTDYQSLAATQEPAVFNKSYALAPASIDPTALIQFISIPYGAEVEIDESGLIVNKDYNYVMTVEQWNKIVKHNYLYLFEDVDYKKIATYKDDTQFIHGNKIVWYDGYLTSINDCEVEYGKKICISDRTECNISEEIDSYVKVYQNKSEDYSDLYNEENWFGGTDNYRVCSKTDTRFIVPQLARNYIQNGVNITTVNGWEIMKLYDGDNINSSSSSVEVELNYEEDGITLKDSCLSYTPMIIAEKDDGNYNNSAYYTLINFGALGQELKIESNKIYCIGWNIQLDAEIKILIGEGTTISSGEYSFKDKNKVCEFNVRDPHCYFLFKTKERIDNPYICIYSKQPIKIKELNVFEAYTKGQDFFEDGIFRYSGRDLFDTYLKNDKSLYKISDMFTFEEIKKLIIFETDVMEGDAYTYTKYFIQQLRIKNSDQVFDTFKAKEYLNEDGTEFSLPLDEGKYTEDDIEINTNYINLNNCPYYNKNAKADEFDCSIDKNKICLYQKYGYCPYRFKTQKHCRKIRTLSGNKSNRFNLTQQLSKIFEIYPIYYTEHNLNGKVTYDENNCANKFVFYVTEKGNENKLGFRYELNLNNISRKKESNQIVTKLYVEDVDSDLSDTGLCTIKTAEDNPSKDNFIIDFSYYNKMGLLDKESTDADLYGIDKNDQGYLKTLGYYNTQYDRLSNKIINIQNNSLTELEANLTVNLEGIETAQQELIKVKKKLDKFSSSITANKDEENISKTYEDNDTYLSYKRVYDEQHSILIDLVKKTFYDENGEYCLNPLSDTKPIKTNKIKPSEFLEYGGTNFAQIKEKWIDTNLYKEYGILGQYNTEYKQIQELKKQRAKYLKDINRISINFFKKYEPFLKEGTWTNSNYLDSNSYYFGAKEVAKDGCIPKVSYNIQVSDLSVFEEYEDYEFNIADTTYIEDIGMFGTNNTTGLPNRLKVLISEITNILDEPSKDSITVQNFTTQFEDLFQQVTASVQSLQFNENIYKRSSNFTSNQNISNKSLQGALDTNDLTIINTDENNINIDSTGQSGSDINNHTNKYKIDGQGMKFSKNGGQTWDVGVGPNGINADYINIGSLDAGKIQIVDNNYLYFLWDKSGITAYRDPKTADGKTNPLNDYTRFNKYGLSLVENNIIRLRAGYYFNGEEGKANTENEISDRIGFYLYNDTGKIIFSTENNTNTARLSLAGEMFISDTLEEITGITYTYNNFKYSCSNSKCYFQMEILQDKKYIFNNNEFINDLELYYNNQLDTSVNKQYTIDDYNYFIVAWGRINNIFTLDRDKEEYYYSKDVSLAINRYTRDKEEEVYLDTYSYIDGFHIGIVKNNNKYSEVAYEQMIDVLVKNSNIYNNLETKSNIEKNNFTILTLEQGIVTAEHVDDVYKVTYLEDEIIFGSKAQKDNGIETHEDSIGIFINNQHINNIDESKDVTRRLLCCAKIENNEIKNIFSILNNGELYIGGTIQERDKNNQNIKSENLNELSDYIVIDQTKDNQFIKLDKNGISLGMIAMEDYIKDKIDSTINSMTLVQHSHSIGGAAVTCLPYDRHTQVTGQSITTGTDIAIENAAICLAGTMVTDNKGPEAFRNQKISILFEDFVNLIKLRIADNERTSTEGSIIGGGSGSFNGYYVEDLG